MLVGTAIFVAPTAVTQSLILLTAIGSAVALFVFNAGESFSLISNIFVAIALVISGLVTFTALGKGGLPKEAGGPPAGASYYSNLVKVLVGTAIVIPLFVIFVSGFTVLPGQDEQYMLINEEAVATLESSESPLIRGVAEFVKEASRPAGLVLILAGLGATFYLLVEACRMEKIARERMFVVFILTFFMFIFWAFFEQSGSSVNNFTDRNIDRVVESSVVTAENVGETVQLRLLANGDTTEGLDYLSQEFLGHENEAAGFNDKMVVAIRGVEAAKEEGKRMSDEDLAITIEKVTSHPTLTMTGLTYLREFAKSDKASEQDKTVQWTFAEENVGKIGLGGAEIPASVFQAVNPIYIMIFGLIFTALWGFLGTRGMEPSTPVKFGLGLVQLGLGFAMLYFGAQYNVGGRVASYWLLLMYLLLTTGELCSSPVGLSMVTKLTPSHLVNTVMGAWFLATAFSQFLAAIIAQFAAVDTGTGNFVPDPINTVHMYGNVYGMIAIAAAGFGVLCLAMSPILKKWMHTDQPHTT